MGAPSNEVREEVLSELVSWLEAERAAWASDWARCGVSPTVTTKRPVAQVRVVFQPEADRPGRRTVTARCSFTHDDVEVSRLNFSGGAPILLSLWTPPPVDAFVRAYGEDFVDGVLVQAQALDRALLPEQGDGPAGRFTPFFARLAGDYLSNLPAVTFGDPVLARRVAESYLEFVEADEITEVEAIPIGGVSPPETPIDAGGRSPHLTLRSLSAEELGELLHRTMLFDALDGPKVPRVTLPKEASPAACMYTSLLTVRWRRPKSGHTDTLKRPLARTVLALQLMGYDIFGPGVGTSWTEPGPRLAQFVVDIRMPTLLWGLPGPRAFSPVDREGLQHALDLMERIPPGCLDKVGDRREVALSRFSMATAQEQDANALIDFVIAMEALLVPGGDKAETKLRFRLHGARYLATCPEERSLVYASLGTLYDARSTLVHGSETRKLRNLQELRRTAHSLAAKGIITALESHWPTADEFKAATLS